MDHRSIIRNMADLKGTPNRMQSPTKNIDGSVVVVGGRTGSNITRSLYQKALAVWVMSRVFYSFARPRAARC